MKTDIQIDGKLLDLLHLHFSILLTIKGINTINKIIKIDLHRNDVGLLYQYPNTHSTHLSNEQRHSGMFHP